MKNYMNEEERRQIDALREAVEKETPEAPASLSRAAIEAHITEAAPKQKKNTARIVRYSLSAAAALIVAFAVLIAQQAGLFSRLAVRKAEQEIIEIAETRTAPNFTSYKELGDYLDRLVELQKKREDANGSLRYGVTFGTKAMEDSAVAEAEAPAAAESYNGAAASSLGADDGDYARTNLRESGVDEADIIKTDGKYIYVLSQEQATLSIIRADGGSMSVAGVIGLEKNERENGWYYSDGMFLYGNYVIVSGREYETGDEEDLEMTRVEVYDISDPAAPQKLRTLSFKGSLANARLIGSRLVMVTQCGFGYYRFNKTDPQTYLPYCKNGDDICIAAPEDIYLPEAAAPTWSVNVYTADVLADDPGVQVTGLLGTCDDIYCTADRLYVYGTDYGYDSVTFGVNRSLDDWQVTTSLYALDLTGEKAAYIGKTSFSGSLLDTFSLDRYNGNLRVAVTDIRYVNSERLSDCRVLVFDDELNLLGESERLADGETVRSVRFMGDTGYMVTFLNTDPLFVLDLSDPAKPVVTGEVKLPGFSEYLHPAGDGLLLGVGYGGDEEGLDGSAKLSLFDVSDPAAPKEVNSLVYEDSTLSTAYKQFVPMGDNGWMVAKENWSYFGDGTTSLVRVAVENGELTEKTVYTAPSKDIYLWNTRGTYIGNCVYMLSFIEKETYVEYSESATSAEIYPFEVPTDAPETEAAEPDTEPAAEATAAEDPNAETQVAEPVSPAVEPAEPAPEEEPPEAAVYDDDMVYAVEYTVTPVLFAFDMQTGELIGELEF